MSYNKTVKCISIRQPWAYLVAHGHKPIENRDWPTSYRGEVYIHASKTIDPDYQFAYEIAAGLGITIPPIEELKRGGIVGKCYIDQCVIDHPSPWFFGPYGFVLRHASPVPFQAMPGKLGIFNAEITIYGKKPEARATTTRTR